MPQKILDIIPPEKIEEKIERKVEKPKIQKVKKNRKSPKPIYLLLVVIVLVGMLYLVSGLFSKATVSVRVSPESKVFEEEVELNAFAEEIDAENKIIPAKFYETEEEIYKTFEVLSKESRSLSAEGEIIVYNEHNPVRAFNFRESTRFLSAEGGKIYRAPEAVYLPPATKDGNKVIPSETKIKVIAQEPGEEYNIDPSKFSIPGLSGSEYYYSVWAESISPIAGGRTDEVSVVTEEDIDNAKNILEEDLKSKSRDSIKIGLPEGYFIQNDLIEAKDYDISCNQEIGTIVESFDCVGEMNARGIAFPLDSFKDIMMPKIESDSFVLGKDIDEKSIAFTLTAKNPLTDSGKIIIDLITTVSLFDRIDKETIKNIISGDDRAIAEKELKEGYDFSEISISLSPFWVRKLPGSVDQIEINLKLD